MMDAGFRYHEFEWSLLLDILKKWSEHQQQIVADAQIAELRNSVCRDMCDGGGI